MLTEDGTCVIVVRRDKILGLFFMLKISEKRVGFKKPVEVVKCVQKSH